MSADEHLVRQAIAPYVGGGSKVTRAAWRRGDIFDDGPITPPWLAAIAIGRPGNAPGNWNSSLASSSRASSKLLPRIATWSEPQPPLIRLLMLVNREPTLTDHASTATFT